LIRHVSDVDDPRLRPYRHIGDPAWLEEQGLFVAEGRLVVQRLRDERRFVVESLLLTPAALGALASDVDAEWPVMVAPQAIVNGVTGFNFHRGCLALVRRPRHLPPLASFADARCLVLLEGVGNPDNVGGIFRSAAAFGADAVLLDSTSGDPFYRKAVRTSMGAVLRVPFARVDPWLGGLATLHDMGFVLVALAPSGELTVDEFAGTLTSKTRLALLAGAEGPGLSPGALAAAHARVRIPVDSRSDSLNVVVAVSIALQRLLAPTNR
jgi:tRNA G18 (ribose-2'-O)-methylase SpoU